eukprot:6188274-Pleurochrysis_carterae.AAC.3
MARMVIETKVHAEQPARHEQRTHAPGTRVCLRPDAGEAGRHAHAAACRLPRILRTFSEHTQNIRRTFAYPSDQRLRKRICAT